jgi:hypothetical protein
VTDQTVMLSTTDTIPGYNGARLLHRGFLVVSAMGNTAEPTFQILINRLKQAAREVNANAVVGVITGPGSHPDDYRGFSYVMSGTAVFGPTLDNPYHFEVR